MSFGDRRLDAALDRWLTTPPEDDDEGYDDWCGCPNEDCSFEGTTAEMQCNTRSTGLAQINRLTVPIAEARGQESAFEDWLWDHRMGKE